MSMPEQNRGNSKQDYRTPPELLTAVKKRLTIGHFSIDLAASFENAVEVAHYTEEDNALADNRTWNPKPGEWAWLNPPYANIKPWVEKASLEAAKGANIVMLLPASPGANWWLNYVVPFAHQVFLNGRITFVGCVTPYPKDCALLLYTPWHFRGATFWNWREHVGQ